MSTANDQYDRPTLSLEIADGYDVLAEQLEQIAVRRGKKSDDGLRRLTRAHLKHHRHA